MAKTDVTIRGSADALSAQVGGFVALSKIDVPFTTVVNRAKMTDLTKDLLPRMGIDRIMTQQIMEVQGESGPNGERVFKPINDIHDQIRFVGDWNSINDASGARAQDISGFGYVEISFVGTGLNLLGFSQSSRTFVASVDGGAETSNLMPAGLDDFLEARNYSLNIIIKVVSGLPYGLHTVKLRSTASAGILVFGFEVMNVSTSLRTSSGTAYVGGKTLSLSSLDTQPYNSSFESGSLGTKGGNVLVYLKDGQVKKAVTATDATQLNLGAANHANEEVVRVYYPREFGAGRSDDLSTATGTASNRYFTIDDNVTSLFATNARVNDLFSIGYEVLSTTGSSELIRFTFVGTGLDVVVSDHTTATTVSVTVDGVSIGSFTTSTSDRRRRQKIVSGLPYGTHVVMLQDTVSPSAGFDAFVVYAPKKPALPANSVELANYYVMADFVANSTIGPNTIATGVLRKSPLREMLYTGDWSAFHNSNLPAGLGALSTTNPKSFTCTFTGTGFDLRFEGDTNRVAAAPVTLNGVALNASYPGASSINCSVYGAGASFGGQTGSFLLSAVSNNNLDQATTSLQSGSGFRVSNLPYDTYTLTISDTTTSVLNATALDIITPIHSPKNNYPGDIQNTLTVGSQGIGDLRALPDVVTQEIPNWATAFGFILGPTNTSTVPVPVPDCSVTIKTNGNPVEVAYSVVALNSTAAFNVFFQVFMDGAPIGRLYFFSAPGASYAACVSDKFVIPVAAGVHNFVLMWYTASATATASGNHRNLTVREL